MNKLQEEIMCGHLLGDGCLYQHPSCINSCFTITRTAADKEYLLWTSKIMSGYLSNGSVREYDVYDDRTKKTYHTIRCRTAVHRDFTKLRKIWYPSGNKVLPERIKLSDIIVAVWFADDGCVIPPKDQLNKRRFELKFATHGFTCDEVIRLQKLLSQKYQVEFKMYTETSKSGKLQHTIRLFKTEECRAFLRAIDQYFPPLPRKSNIWNDPQYHLWEDISVSPPCKHCQSSYTFKNGTSKGIQKYRCKLCGRQFYHKAVV
jgi:hypothetical protein